MNIIVFGATGKTGRHVLRHALDRGHNVTAFTRSAARIEDDRIQIAVGDVLNARDLGQAIIDHDAAIVVLGSSGLRDRSTLSEGTRNVVNAMAEQGTKRLIVLSAAGVGDSWGQISLLAKIMFKTLLRNIYADHAAQERVVTDSALDWTVVRAAVLNDNPGTGSWQAGPNIRAANIARDDVARFMIEQLSDDANLSQSVTISA